MIVDDGVGSSCRRMGMPSFSSIKQETQDCFSRVLGVSDWPKPRLSAPCINVRTDCELPSVFDEMAAGMSIPNEHNGLDKENPDQLLQHPDDEQDAGPYRCKDMHKTPRALDYRFFWSSMALLLENWDIADWALRNVEAWSPEMQGLALARDVTALITPGPDGMRPMTITYVDGVARLDDDGVWGIGGATAWAFTKASPASTGQLGLILPVRHVGWLARAETYSKGGADALCVVTQTASIILHEMVHMIGDGWDHLSARYRMWDSSDASSHGRAYANGSPFGLDIEGYPDNIGAYHEEKWDAEAETGVEWPCFDECHMVASLFMWGMAQRRPCLSTADNCARMGDDLLFAHSFVGGAQSRNNRSVDY